MSLKEQLKETFTGELAKYVGAGAAIAGVAYLGLTVVDPHNIEAVHVENQQQIVLEKQVKKTSDAKRGIASITDNTQLEVGKSESNVEFDQLEEELFDNDVPEDSLDSPPQRAVAARNNNLRVNPERDNRRTTNNTTQPITTDTTTDNSEKTCEELGNCPTAAVIGQDCEGDDCAETDSTSGDTADSGPIEEEVVCDDGSLPPCDDEETDDEVAVSVSCNIDRAQGAYGSPFNLNVNVQSGGKVTYCVQYGGGCCDPLSTPTVYSAPISVGGSGDGDYCVSYFCSNAADETDGTRNTYFEIDSNLPDLTVLYPTSYVQSTQFPYTLKSNSADFGTADFFYHSLNFSYPLNSSTCQDVYEDGVTDGKAYRTIASNVDASVLTPLMQITNDVALSDFVFGTNYLSAILEDRFNGVYSCQHQQVVLRDFQAYELSATKIAYPTNGHRALIGRISSYGFFDTTVNTNDDGVKKNVQGTIRLESGFLSLTH